MLKRLYRKLFNKGFAAKYIKFDDKSLDYLDMITDLDYRPLSYLKIADSGKRLYATACYEVDYGSGQRLKPH